MPPRCGFSSATSDSVSDKVKAPASQDGSSTAEDVLADDFAHFLLLNPYVADGNLWASYYSKDVMMSPKARAELVLPDVKPLPSLVVRDAI